MRLFLFTLCLSILTTGYAFAQGQYEQELQEQQQNTVVIDAPESAAPVQENTQTPPPQFETQKFAVLQTLDKVTARTRTVTVPINTPSAVGPLFIEVKSCQKTPPSEQPEAAAFLQIWEAKPKSVTGSKQVESQWVFSGWMFASSPALSAMNHPIYDVWLKECINEITPAKKK